MQTATGQTIQSVKDTFSKVVVCNAEPRVHSRIFVEKTHMQ
jgi:hypothetical protein